MSLTNLEEVRCPCGEVFEAELVSCINAVQNPELKETLMAGELNIVQCPECFTTLYADHFLLYIDIPEELIAYVHPENSEARADELKAKMNEDFSGVQSTLGEGDKLGCSPVIVFGMDNFLRLLLYEDDQKLEMKVLEHFSKTRKDISLIRIKPSLAREMHMPYLLPVVPGDKKNEENSRDRVLAGLEKLIELAPGLDIYSQLLRRVRGDKSWNIEKEKISRESQPNRTGGEKSKHGKQNKRR